MNPDRPWSIYESRVAPGENFCLFLTLKAPIWRTFRGGDWRRSKCLSLTKRNDLFLLLRAAGQAALQTAMRAAAAAGQRPGCSEDAGHGGRRLAERRPHGATPLVHLSATGGKARQGKAHPRCPRHGRGGGRRLGRVVRRTAPLLAASQSAWRECGCGNLESSIAQTHVSVSYKGCV